MRSHHNLRQGLGVGWEANQQWERKRCALSLEDTALLSYSAPWSPVVNTVMPETWWDLGSLTSLHMQPIAAPQYVCAGLCINVLASSVFLHRHSQSLTVKHTFTCVSMTFRFWHLSFFLPENIQLLSIHHHLSKHASLWLFWFWHCFNPWRMAHLKCCLSLW